MVISSNGAALSYYNGNGDRFGHELNSLQTVLFGVIFFQSLLDRRLPVFVPIIPTTVARPKSYKTPDQVICFPLTARQNRLHLLA
jgi:hypothetical protein